MNYVLNTSKVIRPIAHSILRPITLRCFGTISKTIIESAQTTPSLELSADPVIREKQRNDFFQSKRERKSKAISSLMENFDDSINQRPAPITKHPSDSWACLSDQTSHTTQLDLKSNEKLAKQYVNPYGLVRFGLLLEDIDSMAGSIVYKHVGIDPLWPVTMVTASVDEIVYNERVSLDKDYVIQGCTVHVRVEISPQEDGASPCVEAVLTMVGIDKHTGKPVLLNKLEPQTALEREWHVQGEENKARLKVERTKSLDSVPPSADEAALIHGLFVKAEKGDKSLVPMSSTRLTSTHLCQRQDTNPQGTIFGGFLMRKGFELAYSTSYLFSTPLKRPVFHALDRVTFHRPVHVADILTFTSSVTYTNKNLIHIKVIADVTRPEENISHEVTNVLHLTFRCPENVQMPRILPESYKESMDYLEGRRKLTKLIE